MAKRKTGLDEAWIDAHEAARILSENTDHMVSADYVRLLAKKGHITSRPRDGRTNEYNPREVRGYRVRLKDATRVRPRPSTRRAVS
jgi:hypothetical protein